MLEKVLTSLSEAQILQRSEFLNCNCSSVKCISLSVPVDYPQLTCDGADLTTFVSLAAIKRIKQC